PVPAGAGGGQPRDRAGAAGRAEGRRRPARDAHRGRAEGGTGGGPAADHRQPEPDARPEGAEVREPPSSQEAVVRFLILPALFLTVALLGGIRVDATRAFVLVPPPLVTLVLAVLLARLFAQGGLVRLDRWLGGLPGLTVLSHVLTLLALFFATAQAF